MGRLTGVMGEERSQGPMVGERGKTRGTRGQCSHRRGEGMGLEARGTGLCPLPALVEGTRNSHGCKCTQRVQRALQGVNSDGDGRQTKGQTWGYTEARRGWGGGEGARWTQSAGPWEGQCQEWVIEGGSQGRPPGLSLMGCFSLQQGAPGEARLGSSAEAPHWTYWLGDPLKHHGGAKEAGRGHGAGGTAGTGPMASARGN